jgi:hypothetical protein
MHHAMADGIAGVAVIGALLDPAADVTVRAAPPWTPAAMPSARDLLRDNMRWRIQGLHGLLPRLAHPVSTLRQAQSAWPAWRELWAEERAPRISLNSPVGGHRSLALIRSRLPQPTRPCQADRARPRCQGQRHRSRCRRRWTSRAGRQPWRTSRRASPTDDGAGIAPPRATGPGTGATSME